MNERRKPPRGPLLTTVLLGAVWSLTLVTGIRSLFSYETSPGSVGKVRARWPVSSKISAPNERPILVMVAHPRCPCTQASMDELAKIMARMHGKVAAYVLFLTPSSLPSQWADTDLRRDAERIPGVTVLSDIDGAEAQKFGAETSGHTFLYDRDGSLLFNGGITASRGHAGDNVGESSLISIVEKHKGPIAATHVFGCSLVDRKQEEGVRAACNK